MKERTRRRGLGARWTRVIGVVAPLGVAVGGIAATIAVVRYEDGLARERLVQAVGQAADAAADRLRTLLDTQLGGASATAAALSVDPALGRLAFDSYAEGVAGQLPDVLGIGYVRRVPSDEVAAFELAARADGAPSFTVRDLASGPEHAIVLYNEPAERLRSSWGVDARSIPAATEALDRATRGGHVAVTAPLTLAVDRAQPEGRRPVGYVAYAPVFPPGAPVASVADRRGSVVGWANLPFRVQDLVDQVDVQEGVALVVRDDERIVAARGVAGPHGATVRELVSSADAGLSWTLAVTLDDSGLPPEPDRSTIAAVVGTALTAVLAGLVALLSHSSSRWVWTASRVSRKLETSEERRLATIAALQRSNRDLEAVATIAAHDLSEPLTVIGGYADLLARRYPVGATMDDAGAAHIGTIAGTVQRMRAMLTALLDMASLRSSTTAREPLALDEVVGGALANTEIARREVGATVTVGALPTVVGQRDLLVQLFQNLLANAVRYRHPDRPLQIGIHAVRTGRWWSVRVSDNGIGIPGTQRRRIFQAFRRLDDGSPGLGIGLTVARRIVEVHEGDIAVEDTPGGGTTFVIRLPADLPHDATEGPT